MDNDRLLAPFIKINKNRTRVVDRNGDTESRVRFCLILNKVSII